MPPASGREPGVWAVWRILEHTPEELSTEGVLALIPVASDARGWTYSIVVAVLCAWFFMHWPCIALSAIEPQNALHLRFMDLAEGVWRRPFIVHAL